MIWLVVVSDRWVRTDSELSFCWLVKQLEDRFPEPPQDIHEHDLSLMGDGISRVHREFKGRAQFVLCGFDLRGTMRELNRHTGETTERPIRPDETAWSRYESLFTGNDTSLSPEYNAYLKTYTKGSFEGELDQPYVRRWTMDINKYANNYNYFDVSLAPLVKSDFNVNKSQLKVIEADFIRKQSLHPKKIRTL